MVYEKREKFLNDLAKRIALIRKEKGMSQEKLAENSGVDRVALANIETGRRRPTVTTLHRLAEGLSVPVRDFFPED